MIPRSFTFFLSREDLAISGASILENLVATSEALEKVYGEARTKRLTLPPISLNASEDFDVDISLANRWYERALQAGMRWVNQPFSI